MTLPETTAPAPAPAPAPALDAKRLLGRLNARIALLRAWLSHNHHDEPYWWARKTTASWAQRERQFLREIADLLHVERATKRQRLHGTRFQTLDEQKVWLEQQLDRKACGEATGYAGVPPHSTLRQLRDGALPL